MKKIAVITGTRAEYGLLQPLLEALRRERCFKLQLIATGMHLSWEFGLTYRQIRQDGFNISEKVEMLLSSDTAEGITKSTGLGLMGFADAFKRLRPDMAIVLGDRFETFAAATAAFFAQIPIAHIQGGELTAGVIDEALRHSITKMSHLHFTSTAEYRKRVIQLGEQPARVFNVGSLGIDKIRQTRLLKKPDLERQIGFKLGPRNALVTFHPVTLERDTKGSQFAEILKALDEYEDMKCLFTKPNADTHSRIIIRLIDQYVARHPKRAKAFVSLGSVRYLSLLKYVDVVIGNSSSGIIEAPAMARPTVNIGDRQSGRIRAKSIIDTKPYFKDIRQGISRALSEDFRQICRHVKHPYGNGHAAHKILKIIKQQTKTTPHLKKYFYDLNV